MQPNYYYYEFRLLIWSRKTNWCWSVKIVCANLKFHIYSSYISHISLQTIFDVFRCIFGLFSVFVFVCIGLSVCFTRLTCAEYNEHFAKGWNENSQHIGISISILWSRLDPIVFVKLMQQNKMTSKAIIKMSKEPTSI